MKNIWRNSPSNFILDNLIQKKRGDNQQVITNDFWQSEGIIYYGILKQWNGASWVKESLKTYLAGTWQTKPLKRWNGTDWVIIDTSGG